MIIYFVIAKSSVARDGNTSSSAFKSLRHSRFAGKPFLTIALSLLMMTVQLELVFSL